MSKFRDSIAGSIVILALICLVVTGALAATNYMTKDAIAANSSSGIKVALLEVMPDGGEFTALEQDLPEGIKEAYAAENGGYVFVAVTRGFGGDIPLVVGIDADGAFTGVKMQENVETVGIGSKVGEPEHLGKYIGETSPDVVDAIAGSTVTSDAVGEGLKLCIEAFGQIA